MRAAATALAAFEIAVRGRSTSLANGELIGVHRQAHTAPGLAPVEAGLAKDSVQAFFFGLLFHQPAAGHHHSADVVGYPASLGHGGCGAEVLDACIGTAADEYPIEPKRGDRLPRLHAHVLQRQGRRLLISRVAEIGGVGNLGGDACHLSGIRTPSYLRGNVRAIEHQALVVAAPASVGSFRHSATALSHASPCGQNGRPFRYSNVVSSGANHAGPGTRLDRHVAHGHPVFHGQGADRRRCTRYIASAASVEIWPIRDRIISLAVTPPPSCPSIR